MLDYTLTGMSVIQPETDAKVSDDEPRVDINMKTETKDITFLNEHTDEHEETHNEPEDKALSKKRKSHKSKSSSKKRAKGVAYTEVAAVPLTS